MIVQLTGRLVAKEPNRCVVDVGGVGYGVHISLNTYGSLPENGADVSVHVHTYVREDQLMLYGFSSERERSIFLRLIAISGVGPKTALSILSGLSPEDLVHAIMDKDSGRLSTIPGIGKKTAERMIVELADVMARDASALPMQTQGGPAMLTRDALSALVNLGYALPVAEKALKKAMTADNMSVEDLIRSTLRELCRG